MPNKGRETQMPEEKLIDLLADLIFESYLTINKLESPQSKNDKKTSK